MKLAHRPRIASTTKKLILKQILLSILSIIFKTIQPISAGPNPHPSADTCLPRELSIAMTTSSRSRSVMLQRRDVKEGRQLTLSPDYTCPFLATELNRQQRIVQRFEIAHRGGNTSVRMHDIIIGPMLQTWPVKRAILYVSLCCRSWNRTVSVTYTVTLGVTATVSVTAPSHSVSLSVVRIRIRYQ